MQRTLTLDITVETPNDMTEHDVMDIVRFHLNLGSLNDIEADISAARVLSATLLFGDDTEFRGTADQPVVLPERPYRDWEHVNHGHSPAGRCVKNRFGNPAECTA